MEFDMGLVAASVAIAWTASLAALMMMLFLKNSVLRFLSAFVMAAAVNGMHYTGMAGMCPLDRLSV